MDRRCRNILETYMAVQTNTLGVILDRNTSISANWREFAVNLSTSAIDLFAKSRAEAAAGGVSALIKLVMSMKAELSNGEKAWTLTLLAFAWSVDQVAPSIAQDRELIRLALLDGIESQKSETNSEGLFIPNDFFERPTTLPLYVKIKEAFISGVHDRLTDDAKAGLPYKLDAAFSGSLFEVWARRPELYDGIATVLGSPLAASAERELNWKAYRQQLQNEFAIKPVFGQEGTGIALRDLYVPLRATRPAMRPNTLDELADPNEPIQDEIFLIDEHFDKWFSAADSSDWLRLVGGGPGSGKSTSLKALAHTLADHAEWRPLFIPLQRLDFDRTLRESINSYFVDTTDSPFNFDPLAKSSIEDGPPMVLIFDGLDEIVAPGDAVNEVVMTFATKLTTLFASLTGGQNRPLKVIVSGRMPAFQAAKRHLSAKPGSTLETHGFLPQHVIVDTTPLGEIDQRPIWWGQYARMTGESELLPEAFSSNRLSAITHEPLLCYLLALAGFATQHWELAAENRNRIYSALIDSIYDRGWGDGAIKRQGPGRSLPKSDFNKLMETIALAAWLGGDARVASEVDFSYAVRITGAQKAWATFTSENGPDVANLAMNFYLKAPDPTQRGFEFTHKSFGEYLAARAILNIAEEVSHYSERKTEYALQEWFNATKTGLFGDETLTFIVDEIRLKLVNNSQSAASRIETLKDNFLKLALIVLEDGFPIQPDNSVWRVQEGMQRNSECGLWVVLSSCAKALNYAGFGDESMIAPEWDEDDGMSLMLRRLGNDPRTSIIYNCMVFMKVRKQIISGFNARILDLEGCHLANCLIARCDIGILNLKNTVISEFRLYRARISTLIVDNMDLNEFVIHNSSVDRFHSSTELRGSLAISVMSLIRVPGNSIDSIRANVKLLASRDDEKSIAARRLNSHIKLIRDLETKSIKSLVADFMDYDDDVVDLQN
jgi:hypothetical protein